MESNYWLLLLIFLIGGLILGIVFFIRRYAGLKGKVNATLKESRDQLFRQREKLAVSDRECRALFPDQEAGKSGPPVQKFRANFDQARDANLDGLRKHQRIRQSLPRKEKASLQYWMGEMDRFQIWRKANQDLQQLQLEIDANENRIKDVDGSLQGLKELPLKTAGLAAETDALCRETADLLKSLNTDYGMGGETMEASLQSIAEIEMELEKVPKMFFNPGDLAAVPNIQLEAEQARLLLEPAVERLRRLNTQAKEWKVKIGGLKRSSVSLEDQVKETGSAIDRLNSSLILSEEQERLTSLSRDVDQIRVNLAAPTVESLDPAPDRARQTLNDLTILRKTLNENESSYIQFKELYKEIDEQLQAVDNIMKAAAARQAYPLMWSDSQPVFDDIKEKFTSIPALAERRTPAELAKDLETLEACEQSLSKLKETTDKVVVDLDELSKIWIQLKPAFTDEWLAGVEELFSEVQIYDMESNWDPADRASLVYRDASELMKQAIDNIPSSTTAQIDERQVGSRLLTARDLVERKRLLDARSVRIETRLRQMQGEEKEARDTLKRVSPVVTLFAREVGIINIPIKAAENMTAASPARVDLENSLAQQNQGNISKKLASVRAWERSTAENGAQMIRWVEDDLLKRKVSITGSLQSMETFARDLTDEIVKKAHEYDLEFAPTPIDTTQLRTQSLDMIQEDAAHLFVEWQNVMDIQGELQEFIAPVREEHDRLLAELNDLQEDCAQLGVRLSRDWPVVFQTVSILNEKVKNLIQAVKGSRNLRWSSNDLQRNHYYLFQKLHDLASEAATIRQKDEQDLVEMQTLEKEYQNSLRDYARRVFEGNETAIRGEIDTGEAYLKSLADQYKNGRKNGTNIPPALEVKALLSRKNEAYKQRLKDYIFARGDDSASERERRRQFMPTGKDLPVPLSQGEFSADLLRLIMDLDKITGQHPEIADAVDDLRSAQREATRNRPDSPELKRFLKNARGTLVEVEKTVPEVAPVIEGINMLAGVIRNIFG